MTLPNLDVAILNIELETFGFPLNIWSPGEIPVQRASDGRGSRGDRFRADTHSESPQSDLRNLMSGCPARFSSRALRVTISSLTMQKMMREVPFWALPDHLLDLIRGRIEPTTEHLQELGRIE